MSLEAALKAAADVEIPDEIANGTVEDINARTRLIENEIKMLQMEMASAVAEKKGLAERVKDNKEKIKVNTQLPYLVGNVVEVRSAHSNAINAEHLFRCKRTVLTLALRHKM